MPADSSHVVRVASQSQPPPVCPGVPEDDVSVSPRTCQQEVFVVTGEGEDRTLVAAIVLAQARPGVLLVVETSDITAGKTTVDYT